MKKRKKFTRKIINFDLMNGFENATLMQERKQWLKYHKPVSLMLVESLRT